VNIVLESIPSALRSSILQAIQGVLVALLLRKQLCDPGWAAGPVPIGQTCTFLLASHENEHRQPWPGRAWSRSSLDGGCTGLSSLSGIASSGNAFSEETRVVTVRFGTKRDACCLREMPNPPWISKTT
jgi:hypothetical protein